jgi:hypothetical protein
MTFLECLEHDLPFLGRGADGNTFRLLYGHLSPSAGIASELRHEAQLFSVRINHVIWSTPCCGWESTAQLNGRPFQDDLRSALIGRIKKEVKVLREQAAATGDSGLSTPSLMCRFCRTPQLFKFLGQELYECSGCKNQFTVTLNARRIYKCRCTWFRKVKGYEVYSLNSRTSVTCCVKCGRWV